jgi:hypothetical protein
MNIWWLGRAAPGIAGVLLDGLPKTTAWRERIKALGHGRRTEMTGAEALQVATAAAPAKAAQCDPADPSGLKPGAAVTVRADDYGRDPIEGRLVTASAERITIARECGELDVVHVHFPRVGYLLAAA